MFIRLTVERSEQMLMNVSQIVSVRHNHRIVPSASKPGEMDREPSGSIVDLSSHTYTVRESVEEVLSLIREARQEPTSTSTPSRKPPETKSQETKPQETATK